MDVLMRFGMALAVLASCALPAFGAARAGAQESAAGASEAPLAILAVTPAVDGERLVCGVASAGLPSARAIESMQGGLPSTVEYALSLLDASDRTIAESRVTFRLAFDLWEETFRVDGAGTGQRFDDLDAVRQFLASAPALPVAPLDRLARGERYRIRAALLHRAIATVERARLGAWFSGEEQGASRDPDGREVSLSIGRLIRTIYGGARDADPPPVIAVSRWFAPDELAPAEASAGADSARVEPRDEETHGED
ncbi:MAG: DUF4390 domain-containing protein [bacterium]